MKRIITFAFVFLSLISYVHLSWAVDLESSGQKKVTVKSEIQRGDEAAFSAAQSADTIDLLAQMDAIDRVFAINKQKNADSPGFLLGANFGAWSALSMHLELLKNMHVRNYDLAHKFAINYFQQFRDLQRKMKITDDQLMETIGFKQPLMDAIYKWDYQNKAHN